MKAKRAYHHGNLRAALISAGLAELAREGLDGVSLRGVARRVGVAPTAVYRHFADKEALLAAIADECSDRIAAVMQAAVAEVPASAGPLERFRATGIAYVRFAVAHPEHFRAIAVPGFTERAPPEKVAQQLAWQASERAILERAQDDDEFSRMPLDDALLAASALVHGLAMMIVEGRLGPVDDARAIALAEAATRALGVGFLPRAEAWTDPRGHVRVPGRGGARR